MQTLKNTFNFRVNSFLFLLITSVLFVSFSQKEDPLTKIISGFEKYLEELPQEKIYVHFDRTIYSAGETIWFKGYLTAGAYHEPSALSQTVYVELINENGQRIQNMRLLSIEGVFAGSISLSDTLPAGNYLVRAYTNWMKNCGEAYFFHSPVIIAGFKMQANTKNTDKELDIRFFPEGGNLVIGINSKVAFKAVGANGLGEKVNGVILDGTDVICEFNSNSLGMGTFYLTPQKGKKYKAVIENNNQEVFLPEAQESGLVMAILNQKNAGEVTVKIQTTDYSKHQTLFILAQTRGVVCCSARADLSKNSAVARFPKSEFPTGIAQITILDAAGMPLAERLVFINHNEQMQLKINSDKTTYKPRELIELDIQATDKTGNPVQANLSLAVCDDRQVFIDKNRENISSYFWLSSELKGYLEAPGYYFNPKNEDREEALDCLLLTQGWRKFTVQNALAGQWEEPKYRVEKGLTISGKMTDLFNNKPLSNGRVSYLSVYTIPETKTASTNAKGEFEINDVIHFNSEDAILQGETKRGSKSVKIQIDTSYSFPTVAIPFLPLKNPSAETEKNFVTKSEERKTIDMLYNSDEKNILLDEIKINAPKENVQKYASKIYGTGTASVNVAGNPELETLQHPLQLLQGKVAGVKITGGGLIWSAQIHGASSINSSTVPLILVDDYPVPVENLQTLPVRDIERVMVWKGADAAIFGARGANGAIGFYTRKGIKSTVTSNEVTITFAGEGFQVEREYYSPKYEVQQPEHEKPDKRVTLFWEPYIQTDASGKATVSFYNHDVETSVSAIVEGLCSTGIAGSALFQYQISK